MRSYNHRYPVPQNDRQRRNGERNFGAVQLCWDPCFFIWASLVSHDGDSPVVPGCQWLHWSLIYVTATVFVRTLDAGHAFLSQLGLHCMQCNCALSQLTQCTVGLCSQHKCPAHGVCHTAVQTGKSISETTVCNGTINLVICCRSQHIWSCYQFGSLVQPVLVC
jgi:hypothetical protein